MVPRKNVDLGPRFCKMQQAHISEGTGMVLGPWQVLANGGQRQV